MDVPHHVTQRGNRGLDVFFTDDDRQQYLVWLAEYAALHALKVWAYCLMTNHVHLVVVPGSPEALARVLRPLQMRYSQRINSAHQWAGHLWHGRYFSCPLDADHLWAAVRYVERNPVRAGLVEVAEDYEWSSARVHCGLRRDPVLSPDIPLLHAVPDWRGWLREPENNTTLALLRNRTRDGMPCGDDAFVERIAGMVGRPLAKRPQGRPRK